MSLITGRVSYKPFQYPNAYEFWLKQQQAHWIHTEVAMSSDVQDWHLNLTEPEKNAVGGILKGFTQVEILVNDYWAQRVTSWFPHPEVAMMASTFSAFEAIHQAAYANLNDSLGLTDYDAFLYEPTTKAKLDRLTEIPVSGSPTDIARSLAIFSAFTEGVSLFSSFAVLFNFSRFNYLKGVAQIVAWSSRDEELHSEAGCWLFRTLVSEHPSIWTDELKRDIYEAARVTVALEDSFIDRVFDSGPVRGIDPKDLKVFIRHRANVKLGSLGLKMNWKNLDKDSLDRLSWFSKITSGVENQDFFALRPTAYSKGVVNFDDIW